MNEEFSSKVLIYAHDHNGLIGIGNRLPWKKQRGDLQHFKSTTDGAHLIAGYNTYYSLPTLTNRTVHLINTRLNEDPFERFAETFKLSKKLGSDLFVIGGAKTYEKLEKRCDVLIETVIHAEIDLSDETDTPVYWKHDEDQWTLVEKKNYVADEKNNYAWTINYYNRKYI